MTALNVDARQFYLTKKNTSTTPRRATAPNALSWLNHTPNGASLVATANRLLALQRDVQNALPDHLATACQVLRWQDGDLLLGIPSAAHSAKLRQVVPRLARGLQQQGWQVNEIRVRVQARVFAHIPVPPRGPRAELGNQGLLAFKDLYASLPAQGPLHAAVERLLKRRQADTQSYRTPAGAASGDVKVTSSQAD